MRAAKTDDNQKLIVDGLRKAGISVAITSSMGAGFPDIVCGHMRRNYLFEVKDGNKPPSQRKLTDDQVKFHDEWRGQINVITCLDEALDIIFRGG